MHVLLETMGQINCNSNNDGVKPFYWKTKQDEYQLFPAVTRRFQAQLKEKDLKVKLNVDSGLQIQSIIDQNVLKTFAMACFDSVWTFKSKLLFSVFTTDSSGTTETFLSLYLFKREDYKKHDKAHLCLFQ